jgi:hypothetical protein
MRALSAAETEEALEASSMNEAAPSTAID